MLDRQQTSGLQITKATLSGPVITGDLGGEGGD
jgi:hypothetical protein